MDDKEKAVETKVPPAATEPAKVEPPVTPSAEPDIDYEKEYYALLDEQNKTAEERENYRKGLLRAKGKLPDDEQEETEEDKIRRIAQEAIRESHQGELDKRKEELIKKALRENKELKVALRNRQGVNLSAAAGAGDEPTHEAPNKDWSPEQLAYFKKRGLDPNKVKENYDKAKQSTT